MSSRCEKCDRSFVSDEALLQHMLDSPVHTAAVNCEPCQEVFATEGALLQHMKNAPVHAVSSTGDEALQQHVQDVPARAVPFNCEPCNKGFKSKEALQQHCQSSPAHTATFDCKPCNKSFKSKEALQQHVKNSPAHAAAFECAPCNKKFRSEEALQQHIQNSPAHIVLYECKLCDKRFVSEAFLQQHVQNSPAHAVSYDCPPCNRPFSSMEALQQHLQGSPAHLALHGCPACNESFGSFEELQQHLRASVGQANGHDFERDGSSNSSEGRELRSRGSSEQSASYDCIPCNRSFNSDHALQQHVRDSPTHQVPPATPLDVFFASFPSFSYDAALSPQKSFERLRANQGWRNESPKEKEAWSAYQDALEAELELWFGMEDDLTAWHTLCRAVGVDPPPATCEQCEKALRRTHVNIVDLIDWGRKQQTDAARVHVFETVGKLKEYTLRTKKIYSHDMDKSKSVVLRHLLRKFFCRAK